MFVMCVETKNCLLRMSYDEVEYNQWNDFDSHKDAIKHFIEEMHNFSKDFHRKPKPLKRQEDVNYCSKLATLQTHYKLPTVIGLLQNSNSICDSEIESSEID